MRIKKLTIQLCIFAYLAFLFSFSGLASAANGGQMSLSQSSTDLTSSFEIKRGGFRGERVIIVNVSNKPIQLPVALVVLDNPLGVSVSSPSGITSEGNPYFTIGKAGQLLNQGTQLTVALKYLNPRNLKISPTFRVMAFSASSDPSNVLGGSDNNNNGVRDDIEATVTAHYSNSAKQRAAAFQVLAAYRSILLKQATVEEAFNSVSSFHKALSCMKKIWGVHIGNYVVYDNETRYLENIMLDNKDRIKAYLQIGDKVAGQVFRDTEGQTCIFDSNSLPN